jgi:Winged helix DNA-binding domain
MSVPRGRLGLMLTSAVLGERIARHGLAERPATTPLAATALTTAIQAQDAAASRLGVRARAVDVTETDVTRAIGVDRTIVRTWLMRGTIHLVAASDLPWLVRVIGPSIVRKFRTRWQQLGLTDDIFGRCIDGLPGVLADGPCTRGEVRARLEERGIHLPALEPPAIYHVLLHASALGLVCRGPDRGRDALFVLVDDWLPAAPAGPSGDDALAELARRYFAAYSPATAADFTTWSGLPSTQAITLIRDELKPVDLDGRPAYRLGEVEPARGVRLLPAFDNYLLGHRERTAILERDLQPLVYQGGMIHPTVLRDGRAVAKWSLDRGNQRIVVTPFRRLPAPVRRAVEQEVIDVGRFLDLELSFELAAPIAD